MVKECEPRRKVKPSKKEVVPRIVVSSVEEDDEEEDEEETHLVVIEEGKQCKSKKAQKQFQSKPVPITIMDTLLIPGLPQSQRSKGGFLHAERTKTK